MTQDKPDKKCKVCSFSPGKMIPVSDVRYPVCSGCGEPMLVETSKTKPDKKMRSIRHGGTDDIRCFCRQCEWLDFAREGLREEGETQSTEERFDNMFGRPVKQIDKLVKEAKKLKHKLKVKIGDKDGKSR